MLISPNIAFAQPAPDTVSAPQELKEKVLYHAEDSMIFDIPNQKVYLYGNAHLDYDETTLDASFISFDFSTQSALAKYTLDSNGNKVGRPLLSLDGEEYRMDSVLYESQTKKAIIYNVRTEQGGGYIHAAKLKKHQNNDVHISGGRFTTCNLEHPHFYFRLSKAIVKPDDKIVSGPLNLWIADIPTPLGLPFGFFPNKKGGANGIVIPTYGNSPQLGYFLQNGGYYLRFGETFDTQILGDIYSRGSWGLRNVSRYKKRYKYTGNFNVSFTQLRYSDPEFPDFSRSNEFFVRWNHSQDAKARPGNRFSAALNLGSINNFRNNFNTSDNDYLSNTFNSNISWNKTWKNAPFNLSVNLRHNQNTLTEIVSVTLPEVNLNMNRIYPFRKLGSKNPKSKLLRNLKNNTGISYSANLKNEVTENEKLFNFTRLDELSKKMRNGVRHTVAATTSLKAGPFTINPVFNATERWYLQTIEKSYSVADTAIVTDTLRGFRDAYDHRFSMGITTKLYGNYGFAGFLRGKREAQIRHVLTPTLSFSYRPSFDSNIKVSLDDGTTEEYSPFNIGIYGMPNASESGSIGLNLQNTLDMKYRPQKDTAFINKDKKITLIENFSLRGSYDLVKDSMNLSNIQLAARTKIFKNMRIIGSMTLDPYTYTSTGKRLKQYALVTGNGLGRVTSSTLALSYRFSSKQRKGNVNTNNIDKDELEEIERNRENYFDFNLPWAININYNLNARKSFVNATDTTILTQTVRVDGDISITPKWGINIGTGFDFNEKDFTYTTVRILRDMHCWQGRFEWIPFGARKSYMLTVSVKASILQDLKLQRRRSWYDNAFGGF